jgi:hypothetical protein
VRGFCEASLGAPKFGDRTPRSVGWTAGQGFRDASVFS